MEFRSHLEQRRIRLLGFKTFVSKHISRLTKISIRNGNHQENIFGLFKTLHNATKYIKPSTE